MIAGLWSVVVAALTIGPAPAEAARHLYQTTASGQVWGWEAESAGSLAPIDGMPWNAGSLPQGVVTTPDGKYLYAADPEGSGVLGYEIGPDGAVAPLSGSPWLGGDYPWGIAISPSGRHLYVTDPGSSSVRAYSVAEDGRLTLIGAVQAGVNPMAITLTGDGRFAYVANHMDGIITGYAIAPNGTLEQLPGSDYVTPSSYPRFALAVGGNLYAIQLNGDSLASWKIAPDGGLTHLSTEVLPLRPWGLAASGDGSRLFVSNISMDTITVFRRGPDGVPVSVSTFPAPGDPGALAVSPDGRFLYSSMEAAGSVAGFAIAPDGTGAPVAGSPFASNEGGFQSLVHSPAQPPVAAFDHSPGSAEAGEPVAFDASGSTDDGEIARYVWDFGDGTTLPDGGPAPSHTYKEPGTYEVTLTLTDDEGCSTQLTYTGQTVSCNGSDVAEAKSTVTVSAAPPPPPPPPPPPDEPPVIHNLRVVPKKFKPGPRPTPLVAARKRGAAIKLRLSEDARVHFRIRRHPPNRTGGGPPRNPRSFTRNLKAGKNSIRFSGRLVKRPLPPRRYSLRARAWDGSGQASERVRTFFRIKGSRRG